MKRDGQICWSCGAPRSWPKKTRGQRGKGDELRKGKEFSQGDSSLFLCSKILTTSLASSLLLRENNKGSGVLVSSMTVMAAPWTIRNCLLFRAWLGQATLLHVLKRIRLATFFLPRQLSLGSANFEGFYISISTYLYNPLLLRSWRMNTRARQSEISFGLYVRGRRWWRRRWRTKLFEGLWVSLFDPPGNTTCFDTLISLNSSAGPEPKVFNAVA